MHLPRTILVPTDFSACAEQAVLYGVKLAKQLGSEVYLLHSWNMPYSRWDEDDDLPQRVPSKLEADARARLDARVLELRAELPQISGLFYMGEASASILKAATDISADLIIAGTHGRRGFSRMFEGSVTEYVTRRAPCPVLAVRHTEEAANSRNAAAQFVR